MGKNVRIASIKRAASPKFSADRLISFLTRKEVERFFAAIPPADVRSRLMFSLMYHHALRREEAVGLRKDDLKDGRIWIRRRKHGVSGRQRLYPQTKLYLSSYLSKRGEDDNPYLFASRQSDGPISGGTIYAWFRRYAKEAKLPVSKQHPHVLRHSVAVHLMEAGLDVSDVQDWLGHTDISTTMIYAQVTNKRREKTYLRTIKSSEIADV